MGEPDPRAAASAALEAWAELTSHEDPGATLPRTVADGAVVELVEVTGETVRAICRLAVAPSQSAFVAPNAVSFAEALFEPKAWYRAIVADGVPVGFVMLSIDTETPEYYLWRLMIAAPSQGRGYGRAAMARIIEHVRGLPSARELLVSWVPAAGGPEPFYRALGFEPTRAVEAGEIVARLAL